jgi:signal transduction histidine kinase
MRLRALLLRRGVDALIVALALAAQIELFVDPTDTAHAITATAALFWTLPLLMRGRFPLGASAIVFATLAAESFLPGDAVVQSQANVLALLVAFWVAGTDPALRTALAGAAIGLATIATILLNDFTNTASLVLLSVLGMVAWVVGRALSERGRRAAELELRADRLERAHESAVAEERARIARELHDVIAHSVSVMTVQAGAARLLLDDDPERARSSLLSVENTGRQALADMRRLLGILRSADEGAALTPQPGIDDVPALVEQMRAAGLRAKLSIEGKRTQLAAGVDLTAYRIVQEALTNALKHAGPAPARVAVRYGRERLDVEVVNEGPLRGNGTPGHGLIGMRERVALYGGTLSAAPTAEGGFRVHAQLPVEPRDV